MTTETINRYTVDRETGEVLTETGRGPLVQGAFPGMAKNRPINRAACIATLGQLTRDIDVLTRGLKAKKRAMQDVLDMLDVMEEDTGDDD